jgi:hypothetical protein
MVSNGREVRRLRQENWELNNRLRAAESKIIELQYLRQTVKQRESGELPTELKYQALKLLNVELLQRIQKLEASLEALQHSNGKEEASKEAEEGSEESDIPSDGLYMECRE